jgi:hypothetical protein
MRTTTLTIEVAAQRLSHPEHFQPDSKPTVSFADISRSCASVCTRAHAADRDGSPVAIKRIDKTLAVRVLQELRYPNYSARSASTCRSVPRVGQGEPGRYGDAKSVAATVASANGSVADTPTSRLSMRRPLASARMTPTATPMPVLRTRSCSASHTSPRDAPSARRMREDVLRLESSRRGNSHAPIRRFTKSAVQRSAFSASALIEAHSFIRSSNRSYALAPTF